MLGLVAGIVGLGIYPQPVLDMSERPGALVQKYYAPASRQPGASAP